MNNYLFSHELGKAVKNSCKNCIGTAASTYASDRVCTIDANKTQINAKETFQNVGSEFFSSDEVRSEMFDFIEKLELDIIQNSRGWIEDKDYAIISLNHFESALGGSWKNYKA